MIVIGIIFIAFAVLTFSLQEDYGKGKIGKNTHANIRCFRCFAKPV